MQGVPNIKKKYEQINGVLKLREKYLFTRGEKKVALSKILHGNMTSSTDLRATHRQTYKKTFPAACQSLHCKA